MSKRRKTMKHFLFQFTPLREGLLGGTKYLAQGLKFQFTPLREGLHGTGSGGFEPLHFNSRPCGRGFSKNANFSIGLLLFFIQ